MLSSTKRRILNIICVSLAICSVGYGLILKFNGETLEPNMDFSVQTDSYTPKILEVNSEPDYVEDEDLISNPD